MITTPLPAPSSIRPPLTRRETRKLATEGVSRVATETTAREYASSGSSVDPRLTPPGRREAVEVHEQRTQLWPLKPHGSVPPPLGVTVRVIGPETTHLQRCRRAPVSVCTTRQRRSGTPGTAVCDPVRSTPSPRPPRRRDVTPDRTLRRGCADRRNHCKGAPPQSTGLESAVDKRRREDQRPAEQRRARPSAAPLSPSRSSSFRPANPNSPANITRTTRNATPKTRRCLPNASGTRALPPAIIAAIATRHHRRAPSTASASTALVSHA